jgi:Domain of unknown function (DUF4440)
MTSDFDALTQLNVQIGVAEAEGDKDSLGQKLAPVLAFRRADGTCVDRAAFLDGITRSASRQTTIESITLLGADRALVTCVVSMSIDDTPKRFHNVRLFVRSDDGEWKLLGWANEPI